MLLHDLEQEENGGGGDELPSGRNQKASQQISCIFDICSCSCSSRNSCHCPKERKIHRREWNFLEDQKNDRDHKIGEIDKEVTEAWQEGRADAFESKVIDEELRCDQVREDIATEMEEFLHFENDDNIDCAAENEEDFHQEDQS